MAAQSPGGTSYSVFGNFPIPMAGKTGTAERLGQGDQSWYVALAPYPNPQIVVAATIEQGGFGVEAAAPVAAQVLAAYFNVHNARPRRLEPKSRRTDRSRFRRLRVTRRERTSDGQPRLPRPFEERSVPPRPSAAVSWGWTRCSFSPLSG